MLVGESFEMGDVSEEGRPMFEADSFSSVFVELNLIIVGETDHRLVVDVEGADVFPLACFEYLAMEVVLLFH